MEYNHCRRDLARRDDEPGPGRLPLDPASLQGAFTASGYYEPNSYSRYYAAAFATFNRFLMTDMTLTLNVIGNLDQECAMISSGISYRDLNDFSLGVFVNGFAGPANTEYTFSRQAVQLQVLAQADF